MIKKLPKPPLTEVVFEMRWKMLTNDTIPFPYDPSYPQLLDTFSKYAAAKGFVDQEDTQAPYSILALQIARRFQQKDSKSFPLLQIGPGLYAANESVNYDWDAFKKMAIDGASVIESSFPKLDAFGFNLDRLELRYIDTFDEDLIGTADLLDFMNKATTASVSIPELVGKDRLKSKYRGRIFFEADAKKPSGSVLSIDLISAARKKSGSAVIRMTTKVFSREDTVFPKSSKRWSQKLDDWLEDAHHLTSTSFRRFVRPEVYEKFQ